jgi:calcium/calmodulin-dependent protein kinase I
VPIQSRLSDFETRHPTAKSFIRALLNPDPARRPTAEQALAHTWLTSFAAPTEHDLSGMHENFGPRARWRSAISTARALSRFAHYKGANHLNDRLAISTDEEDDGSGGGSTSWRATPGSDTKRQPQSQQQQHLSPPSPDDRAPRRGLAGLAATGTSRLSTSSPMSFSEAINKAKASVEAEKKADAPRAQTNPAAFQLRKTEEEEEEEDDDEAVELRIPGSFSFGNVGGGAAQGAGGAGTDDPFDAVGMLGSLWRCMQLR